MSPITAPTADELITWIELTWLGWQEPWDDDHIPWQERHGYPRGVVVEWCGGLLMEGIWQTSGSYGIRRPPDTAPNCWYTVTGARDAINLGTWTTTSPHRGDFVLFDWGGTGLGDDYGKVDHIGIVTGPLLYDAAGNPVIDEETGREVIDTSGGYIDTIEGNVDEACGRFRRRFASGTIKGFIRPDYRRTPQPAEEPTPPPPPAIWHPTEGDDDMVIIDVTEIPDDEQHRHIPRTFQIKAGVLSPVDAPEIGYDPNLVPRISEQWPTFRTWFAHYCWRNRLGLDLKPLKPAA